MKTGLEELQNIFKNLMALIFELEWIRKLKIEQKINDKLSELDQHFRQMQNNLFFKMYLLQNNRTNYETLYSFVESLRVENNVWIKTQKTAELFGDFVYRCHFEMENISQAFEEMRAHIKSYIGGQTGEKEKGTLKVRKIDTVNKVIAATLTLYQITSPIINVVYASPRIDNYTQSNNNDYVVLQFNEGVYGSISGMPIDERDLYVLLLSGSPSLHGVEISSIEKVGGGALEGGETQVRVNLNISGTASGIEKISIDPIFGANIFNSSGEIYVSGMSTGPISLLDRLAPSIVSKTAIRHGA